MEPLSGLSDRVVANQIPPSLWDSFFGGSRLACARLITRVENDPRLVPLVRDVLSHKLGAAIRIGITGPHGVGKSTLTSLLAQGLADVGHGVGVIAVDPSSPFTGGAFMGDRVRMDSLVGNDRIFVRSMASREGHGGLSPSTPYVSDVLEAFGKSRILIETVGVGQAELDVLSCTDLVLLILQPVTGDAIQTLKAGILEAADIVVVNKSDLPGAASLVRSLEMAYGMASRSGRKVPPVLLASAQESTGIKELLAQIEDQAEMLQRTGRHRELRLRRLEEEIRQGVRERLWQRYLEITGAADEVQRRAESLVEERGSPYPYIEELAALVEIKAAQRSEADGIGAKDAD